MLINEQIIDISNDGQALAAALLNGQLISFHDEQYEVTTGRNEMLMKLYFDQEALVVFYIQVPFGYPMPDGLKMALKMALATALQKTEIDIEFINAATEAQKRDMNFRIELSGELGESDFK